jgi:hypothetical protein
MKKLNIYILSKLFILKKNISFISTFKHCSTTFLKKLFFFVKFFLYILDCFYADLKNNFKKTKKKHHFDIFQLEKYFQKQPQLHFQTGELSVSPYFLLFSHSQWY